MRIELICVGSELLVEKVNTDARLIGEKLHTIGLALSRVSTVGDDMDEMVSVLTDAITRSDLVILTGGLGPTFDDFTREAVAKVLNRKLIFNREAMQMIAALFAKRNREMPKINERQAYVIDGGTVLINPAGTAPGQAVEFKSQGKVKAVILLPGPPTELNSMLNTSAGVYLKDKYRHGTRKTVVFHIFGEAESVIDEMIRPVVDMERKFESEMLTFGILAHRGIIDVKYTVAGDNELMVDNLVNKVRKELLGVIGGMVYGEDGQTLESVTANLLLKHKKTVAVAESCTAGMIASKLTSVAGSSIYFKGGIIAYDNSVKTGLLGVTDDALNTHGAVSEEVALQMARGVKQKIGTTCAVATTGIAGPGGGTKEKPVGLVYIGMVIDDKEYVDKFQFFGVRNDLRERFAMAALNLLRQRLL
ncbi:MAG: competence/damage-inducible protein A [Elusimicrobiota bacterium]